MNTFKVIESKVVYKSEKVQVDKVLVRLPDGKAVEWDAMVYPNIYLGVTIMGDEVLMTREWRLGPRDFLTQFTKARAAHESEKENLQELARELKEELGVEGGNYKEVLKFAHGERLTGFCSVYFVTDFNMTDTNRDEDEIQEIIKLPIKNLYNELKNNHIVMPESLLIAKILEERFGV